MHKLNQQITIDRVLLRKYPHQDKPVQLHLAFVEAETHTHDLQNWNWS